MHGGTANAFNVLLQNAPQGCAYTATTRIDLARAGVAVGIGHNQLHAAYA